MKSDQIFAFASHPLIILQVVACKVTDTHISKSAKVSANFASTRRPTQTRKSHAHV